MATNHTEISLKLRLVYTCNYYCGLERDKKCIEKYDKNAQKNRLCKPGLTLLKNSKDCCR